MTPDRLVEFIPTVLEWLLPSATPEISGDAAGICSWLEKISHNASAKETVVPDRFPAEFWPRAPSNNTSAYSLTRAPSLPLLRVAASTPVKFCNYTGHNAWGDALPALENCKKVAGHVIASNGELAFSREDFSLPGPFRFRWQRVYRQSQKGDDGLGRGWRHSLNEHLQLPSTQVSAEQKILLHTAEGRIVAFDLPAIGHACYNRSERLYLLRQSLHSFRVSAFATPDKIFRADGTGETAPLCEIRDASGNTLSVDYRDGLVDKIVTSWGTSLTCHHEDGRLVRITDRRSEENLGLLEYSYSSAGDLVATRSQYCRESFTVQSGRIKAINDLNIGHLDFTYNQIDRVCQVALSEETDCQTAAQAPDGTLWRLRWRSGSRTCTVSTSDRYDTLWRFDDSGNLVESTQRDRTQRWRYDLYRNLCHTVDTRGLHTLYRHDAFGRLLRQTDNGQHRHYLYDDTGGLIAAGTVDRDGAARRWQYHYTDTHHFPTAVTDPEDGTWACEHDERGQLRSLTDPEGGRLLLEWDAQCQLTRVVRGDCRLEWEYDQQGRMIEHRATGLPARRWVYDNRGTVIRAVIGEHTLSISSDEYDRPCTFSEDGEPLLQWQYDGFGHVRYIQEAEGPALVLDYNRGGQLCALRRKDQQYTWHYDPFGQLTAFDDGNTLKREWQFDRAGQLREFRDGDSHWYLQYNDHGAIAQIRNNSGQICNFHFDMCGRLTQADNEHCNLRYRYDRCDRLIAEHHDLNAAGPDSSLSINHSYDRRGWLKNSCSDSINIVYTFSPSGQLYGIDLNGAMAVRSEIQQDDRESDRGNYTERLFFGSDQVSKHYCQGILQSLSLGKEPLWSAPTPAPSHRGLIPSLELFATAGSTMENERDMHGNLVMSNRRDAGAGAASRHHYQYDGWGLLQCVECGDFKTWLRYDPFGRRLMKASTHRRSGRQRRVASHWSGIGLWGECVYQNGAQVSTHYVLHPLTGSALARVSQGANDGGTSDGTISEHREFFVTDDSGQLLALLPDVAPTADSGKPIWTLPSEQAAPSQQALLCPGSYQGRLGIYDRETRLFYRHFRYFLPAVTTTIAADSAVLSTGLPLDSAQEYLTGSPAERSGAQLVVSGQQAPTPEPQT